MKIIDIQEINLILYSLNETFHNASDKLAGTNLGDVERSMVEKTKNECKDLITKLQLLNEKD